MKPERTKATGRVNRPSTIKTPPTKLHRSGEIEQRMRHLVDERQSGGKADQLARAVLQEQQSRDDPQNRVQRRRPALRKARPAWPLRGARRARRSRSFRRSFPMPRRGDRGTSPDCTRTAVSGLPWHDNLDQSRQEPSSGAMARRSTGVFRRPMSPPSPRGGRNALSHRERDSRRRRQGEGSLAQPYFIMF